jgi:hypothetical protein
MNSRIHLAPAQPGWGWMRVSPRRCVHPSGRRRPPRWIDWHIHQGNQDSRIDRLGSVRRRDRFAYPSGAAAAVPGASLRDHPRPDLAVRAKIAAPVAGRRANTAGPPTSPHALQETHCSPAQQHQRTNGAVPNPNSTAAKRRRPHQDNSRAPVLPTKPGRNNSQAPALPSRGASHNNVVPTLSLKPPIFTTTVVRS